MSSPSFQSPESRALRVSLTAIATASLLALGGCGMIESITGGDKVDYRTGARKTAPLEVPPDLTQLSRDGRYAPQSGSVSATALQQQAGAGAVPTAATGPQVAPTQLGDVRIERAGAQRWLVTATPPERLWPTLRSFWTERGFDLVIDNPEIGLIETEWAENRAKLPDDIIRNTIGRFFNSLYSTGERDKYRMRVERNGPLTEIYITHRGLTEVLTGSTRDQPLWTARPADPGLEGEMLARLLERLGTPADRAQAQVAATAPAAPGAAPAAAPAGPARARTLAGPNAALELDEPFDRAWRRVGLALDRGGFTVEDRDRSGGTYFVRYVDPKSTAAADPNFFERLFGADDAGRAPVRYRVQIARGAAEGKSQITVLDANGAPATTENARSIAALLVQELK